MTDCPFCDYEGPSEILAKLPGVAYVIRPIDPVTPGHLLVVSYEHLRDFTSSPVEAGEVMRFAARWAQRFDSCNLITSRGAAATQTVMHLHVHLVPRYRGDGLLLPWST